MQKLCMQFSNPFEHFRNWEHFVCAQFAVVHNMNMNMNMNKSPANMKLELPAVSDSGLCDASPTFDRIEGLELHHHESPLPGYGIRLSSAEINVGGIQCKGSIDFEYDGENKVLRIRVDEMRRYILLALLRMEFGLKNLWSRVSHEGFSIVR